MICQKKEDCLLTCARDLPHLAHLFSEQIVAVKVKVQLESVS
ncbi:hypothetical protein HanRHA438_Chr15g0732061 [Helianthus annuus]|nr:hypothetical protein HanIR_Chr15g0783181 [Helianthus annuus]KAJ0847073.1 hypothetical protein HanRHA438_Chr15g0732061 [Helianthus annuus]